jgi:hypothetical protein
MKQPGTECPKQMPGQVPRYPLRHSKSPHRQVKRTAGGTPDAKEILLFEVRPWIKWRPDGTGKVKQLLLLLCVKGARLRLGTRHTSKRPAVVDTQRLCAGNDPTRYFRTRYILGKYGLFKASLPQPAVCRVLGMPRNACVYQ